MIGEDPVDLLRHPPVEGAQPRLHMGDGDVQLGRRQRPCEGGVRVAIDQHRIGPFGLKDRLQRLKHPAGHGAVPAAVDAQIVCRLRELELAKELLGHLRVEMLPSVNDPRARQGAPPMRG